MTAVLFCSGFYLSIFLSSDKNLSITNACQGKLRICWVPHNEEVPACCLSPLLVCSDICGLQTAGVSLCYGLESLNNEGP